MEIIKKYLSHRKILVLSKVDIYDLINKSKKGCKKSRELAIIHNVPMVMNIAKRYFYATTSVISFEDLFQEGILGLIRAIELFDTSLGFSFSTYADPWVKQKMTRYIDDNRGPVRTPIYLQELKRKYAKMKKEDDSKTDDFYLRYIAKRNGCTLENLRYSITHNPSDVRIDDPLDLHQLSDIVDERKLDLALFDFEMMLKKIDPRERFIIERRMCDWTLKNISDQLGISRERVRQIEADVLRKLKAMVTDVKDHNVFETKYKKPVDKKPSVSNDSKIGKLERLIKQAREDALRDRVILSL